MAQQSADVAERAERRTTERSDIIWDWDAIALNNGYAWEITNQGMSDAIEVEAYIDVGDGFIDERMNDHEAVVAPGGHRGGISATSG